jgi:Phage tail assembly chaperone proteins, E, or 41 or 14
MSEVKEDKPALAGPVTYTLLVPVDLRNKDGEVIDTVRELTLNRINGGAARKCMNAYARGPGDFAFELVCASARIPPSTFDKLDAEDVTNLTALATPFFSSGQATQ